MDLVDVSVTLAPAPSKAWPPPREWLCRYLRDTERGPETPWTMSVEEIVQVLDVFERSGATPKEAASMVTFLPESFCRQCVLLGGVHLAKVSPIEAAMGRRVWVAGPPGAALARIAEGSK